VLEHVDALATQMEIRGHHVCVIAPNDPLDLRTHLLHPKLGRHGPLPSRVEPAGRSVPVPLNGSLANLAFSPSAWGAVRRAVRRQMPDVMHVHEPLVPVIGWAALAAAEASRIPVVGTFHASYPEKEAYYRTFRAVKKLVDPIDRANRIMKARVAVSPLAARTASRYFPGEYRIVPNGVDTRRFAPPASPERDSNLVLFVGRPEARKGLPVLLRAFGEVLYEVPEARLEIVGSRPEDVKLPKHLLSSVRVRGMLDERELVEAMHSASVLCAPSIGSESFGVVLIEALAAGLPVLASDIPGYNAVITRGKEGILVPPGDPQALAAELVRLLKDPALRARLSNEGLVTARRYDWPQVASEIEEIYRSVVKRKRPVGFR
jgi:phosphatidylinositol alpha-mannosyltransferase